MQISFKTFIAVTVALLAVVEASSSLSRDTSGTLDWEELSLRDLPSLLNMGEFDINVLPWERIPPMVLEKIMEEVSKSILISKNNDHLLSDELIYFATLPGSRLWQGFQCSSRKITPQYRKLLTAAQENLIEGSPLMIYSKISRGDVRWDSLIRKNVNFDVNDLPWHFFDIYTLSHVLEASRQPIYINSENDHRLTLAFIEEACDDFVSTLWKYFRHSSRHPSDIPKYISFMVEIADSVIFDTEYDSALSWMTLTSSLRGDERVSDAADRLAKKMVRPPNWPEGLDFNFLEMNDLISDYSQPETIQYETLMAVMESIFPINSDIESNIDFLILLEHHPLILPTIINSHQNEDELEYQIDNLSVFKRVLEGGGKTYRLQMATSFFTCLLHVDNITGIDDVTLSSFFTEFGDTLTSAIPSKYFDSIDFIPMIANHIFSGNQLATQVSISLINNEKRSRDVDKIFRHFRYYDGFAKMTILLERCYSERNYFSVPEYASIFGLPPSLFLDSILQIQNPIHLRAIIRYLTILHPASQIYKQASASQINIPLLFDIGEVNNFIKLTRLNHPDDEVTLTYWMARVFFEMGDLEEFENVFTNVVEDDKVSLIAHQITLDMKSGIITNWNDLDLAYFTNLANTTNVHLTIDSDTNSIVTSIDSLEGVRMRLLCVGDTFNGFVDIDGKTASTSYPLRMSCLDSRSTDKFVIHDIFSPIPCTSLAIVVNYMESGTVIKRELERLTIYEQVQLLGLLDFLDIEFQK